MRAELRIDMDNEAFENRSELPRVLRHLASVIERGEVNIGESGEAVAPVMDANGNLVGRLLIIEGE